METQETEQIIRKLPSEKFIHSVSIEARKWFQKTYGNTYHSVKITIQYTFPEVMPIEVIRSGRHYGYGEQWNQTALDIFCDRFKLEVPRYPSDKHGLGTKKFPYLTTFLREHLKLPFYQSVIDVSKQSDLNF